jgi:hypothetical protein
MVEGPSVEATNQYCAMIADVIKEALD